MSIKYIFFDTSNYMYRMYSRAAKDLLDPFKIFQEEVLYTTKSFSNALPVWALDCPRHENWRKKIYPEYKGNRSEEDPIFSAYKKECIEWLDSQYLIIGHDKMEADDVIGSLATKYYPCYISTTDNDFYQLLDDNLGIYVLRPNVSSGFTQFGSEQFEGLYGISPRQYIDYKSLVGDTADNFKGCPGIGKKGAVKLLSKYKTLDEIYKVISPTNKDFTPKIYNSLKDNKEYVYLCKKLATIVTNLSVSI